jgi:UbiD family decarboxylase
MDRFSLSSLIDKLANQSELIRLPNGMSGYEIAQIASDQCKSNGKAIIVDTEIPIVLNLFASDAKIELALGDSIESIAHKAFLFDSSAADELTYTDADSYTELSNISQLPILKHHAGDVSGSINMGCVISKADDTYNCGIYRLQPISDDRLIVHCYPSSGLQRQLNKGKDVHVTIAVGTSPHLIYAAASYLPSDTDELKLANHIHTDGLRYIKTGQHPVPAETHIIIQGIVSAHKKHPEGPFLIYTGDYSEVAEFPVMQISSVKIKEGAVYHTTVTGIPPMESAYIGRACAKIHEHRIKATCPDIIKVVHPLTGVFGKVAIVTHTGNDQEVLAKLQSDRFYGKFEKIELLQH